MSNATGNGNENGNECVVCYSEKCSDYIPCEVCKKIVCVDCANKMATISGFFCPACKAGKSQQPPLTTLANLSNPNIQAEEDARIAMFQQMRDAFDVLGPVVFTPINLTSGNHNNHIYNIVSNILDTDLGLDNLSNQTESAAEENK
jgi:hypothetical protein